MSSIKPNNFPTITPTGTTEIYTQTDGINGKFTLQQIADYVAASNNEWQETTIDISSAEILNIGISPKELLPAAGDNKYYDWEAYIEYDANDSAYTIPFDYLTINKGSVGFDIITFNTNRTMVLRAGVTNNLDTTDPTKTIVAAPAWVGGVNFPLEITTAGGTNPFGGTGTLKIKLRYKVITKG